MSDKKKFVIRPFRPQVHMNANSAERIWGALKSAINEIHNKNASSLSFEELYRNAYNLVLHKHGNLLYSGVESAVTEHLKGLAHPVMHAPDELLLQELNRIWADHKLTMNMIKDILMYMDRTFVQQNRRLPIYDLGLYLFRTLILQHHDVRERLRAVLLNAVARERQGELVDRALLKSTVEMLVEVGIRSKEVYVSDFEEPFLRETADFYRTESLAFLSENTVPEYLQKAESRLVEERLRVTQYLDSSTETKLRATTERELLHNHAVSLVENESTGLVRMMEEDKLEDLERMFRLFNCAPSVIAVVRDRMTQHVKALGMGMVQDPVNAKEPVKFVQELLALREKYDRIIVEAFHEDKAFQQALKESFESFINVDARAARNLCLYLDDLLKSKLRTVPEGEVEGELDKAVLLFRFVQDKDVFESFYKQLLAKRLLAGRSVSDDAERLMVTKLKTECGYQFTSKLEGMFQDLRVSEDIQEKFRDQAGRAVEGVELAVRVLTTGHWPSKSVPKCILPPELEACCRAFEQFYLGLHTGRRLAWQTSMGNADVRGMWGSRRYEFVVSTYQMVVLVLFNSHDRLKFSDIVTMTQIPPDELRRHLVSMAVSQFRILIKERRSRDVADDDVFFVNPEYKSKLARVKVPLVSLKEQAEEAVPEPVMEDRRHLTEAAIVRIMKARKTLDHNSLVAEVTRQLAARFRPEPILIKRRIESLIEREYLERSESDHKTYNYLA